MTSQYDEIGQKYDGIKKLVTSMVEEENVRHAVQPYLARVDNPRVLDLACGTGYYSKKAVDWGADYVLGIDQSQGMIDAATSQLPQQQQQQQQQQQHHPKYEGKVRFQVGDALRLGKVDGEALFDVVLGCWLLNYASSLDEMAQMLRTVAVNLRPGGAFVALTPDVCEDVDARAARWPSIQATLPADFPIRIRYYERLPSGEGWKTEISNVTEDAGTVTFRNFVLRASVYAEGARRAGLAKLEWRDLVLSEATRAHLDQLGWTSYFEGREGEGGSIKVLVVGKDG